MTRNTLPVCAAFVSTLLVSAASAQAPQATAPAQSSPGKGTQPTTAQAPQQKPVSTPATPAQTPPAATATPAAVPVLPGNAITPPPGYLIGADDVLSIVFWKDKDMTGDVVVRPDGM